MAGFEQGKAKDWVIVVRTEAKGRAATKAATLI